MRYLLTCFTAICLLTMSATALASEGPAKIVRFPSGELTLGGELFLPAGDGPFPTILFNHGSAPKMHNSTASAAIAPHFTERGWALFMPYRRGQGLSEGQGAYILDAIKAARWTGFGKAAKKMVELTVGEQFDDHMAALQWLRQQAFADPHRIATLGNSFGGVQVMLGMEQADYCAGVNAAGAAQSWDDAADLQRILKRAATAAKGPIMFFQAENDYDLTPSKELHSTMARAGKTAQLKIYPAFGASASDGHSFAYQGVSVWFEDVMTFLDTHCPAQAGEEGPKQPAPLIGPGRDSTAP